MEKLNQKKSFFKFSVISRIKLEIEQGYPLSSAVKTVSEENFFDHRGRVVKVNKRTLYRWIKIFNEKGMDGLVDVKKKRDWGKSLGSSFAEFMIKEKQADPDASIPEIIRRALEDGVIDKPVNRTTAYRLAIQHSLPIYKKKELGKGSMRRFAHRHRLRVVLCDGKHFRAGIKRDKRVVMTFMDDAHRMAIGAVVSTSENKAAFLKGLHIALKNYGKFAVIYLDHGSAFIANDVKIICSKLNISVVHGTKAYPEGHAKIERFHDTLINDLLRGLDGNPGISSQCSALEHLMHHYIYKTYNLRYHEGIKGIPREKFMSDKKVLDYIADEKLIASFILEEERKVSKDHIVKVDGENLETPLGYAGTKIRIFRHILENKISIQHHDKTVFLNPVDLDANAKQPRGRRIHIKETDSLPPITAAMRAYKKDFLPVIDANGNLIKPNKGDING